MADVRADELNEGTVARVAALAARGDVADPVLAVQCSVAFLVLPEHVRGACPASVRAGLDDHAWKVAAWAGPRHIIAASGPAPSRWLDGFAAELGEIDARTFHELLALAQQCLQDLLTRSGAKVRDALKAAGSVVPVIELAEIPAWAARTQTITAAISARQADAIVIAANELVRRSKRVLAAAIEASAGVIAANLSADAADRYRSGSEARVAAAAAALAAAFTATATSRFETGTTDDGLPVSSWFPAAAIWGALTIAGSANDSDGGSPSGGAIAGVALGPLGAQVIDDDLRRIGKVALDAPNETEAAERSAASVVAVNVARAVVLGRIRFGVRKIWEHRTGHNYFDPHKALHGQPSEPEDRFVHSNSWPRGGKYQPGDHAGCRCRWRLEPFLELIGKNDG